MGVDLKIAFTPVVKLLRLEAKEYEGTFGVLLINTVSFCATLEPPDRENEVNRSSIPAQQYICIRRISPTFGETFEVMHVPGRTDVLFHPGNWVKDTKGCIVLGQYWDKLRGDRAVINSGKTFETFMSLMEGIKFFHFTIKEVY